MMRIKVVGLVSVLLCILQAHGSSILSPSDHEHSPELSSLLEWLKQNGATVCPLGIA